MQFPEAVQNRVRAMTENRRFRNFVFGMPFSFNGIDKAWLYIFLKNQFSIKLWQICGKGRAYQLISVVFSRLMREAWKGFLVVAAHLKLMWFAFLELVKL